MSHCCLGPLRPTTTYSLGLRKLHSPHCWPALACCRSYSHRSRASNRCPRPISNHSTPRYCPVYADGRIVCLISPKLGPAKQVSSAVKHRQSAHITPILAVVYRGHLRFYAMQDQKSAFLCQQVLVQGISPPQKRVDSLCANSMTWIVRTYSTISLRPMSLFELPFW